MPEEPTRRGWLRLNYLAPLTVAGPEDYRLRVHAHGRVARGKLMTEEPVENYLIIAWPAPAQAEVVRKASDAAGASSRRSVAQQHGGE